MKGFISGVLTTLLVLVLAAFTWLYTGGMPVSTRSAPLPLERQIAHIAIDAAMRGKTDLHSPILSDEANLLGGAKVYKSNCAVCHGLPGQSASAIAAGLFPKPPPLMPPHKGVTDDPEGETFWIVKNGVRLTGMPGFEKGLTDNEIWQVTVLLRNTDKLPPSVKSDLEK